MAHTSLLQPTPSFPIHLPLQKVNVSTPIQCIDVSMNHASLWFSMSLNSNLCHDPYVASNLCLCAHPHSVPVVLNVVCADVLMWPCDYALMISLCQEIDMPRAVSTKFFMPSKLHMPEPDTSLWNHGDAIPAPPAGSPRRPRTSSLKCVSPLGERAVHARILAVHLRADRTSGAPNGLTPRRNAPQTARTKTAGSLPSLGAEADRAPHLWRDIEQHIRLNTARLPSWQGEAHPMKPPGSAKNMMRSEPPPVYNQCKV